jgi:hypothetical protein
MCTPRSILSWDIVVQRVGNKLFFDKRDGAQIDLLTVNETAQEQLPENKDDISYAGRQINKSQTLTAWNRLASIRMGGGQDQSN